MEGVHGLSQRVEAKEHASGIIQRGDKPEEKAAVSQGEENMSEHWRDYAFDASRYNCERDCPHLEVAECGKVAFCNYYGEQLAYDGSIYGEWFMCGDCADDSYGGDGT